MLPARPVTAVAVLVGLVVAGIGVQDTPDVSATPQPVDWEFDPPTGVLWRPMTSTELGLLGYPSGATGWLTQNYGDLDDFTTDQSPVIRVKTSTGVSTIPFDLVDTQSVISGLQLVLPLGTPLLPGQEEIIVTQDIDRTYLDGTGWHAVQAGDQWQANRFDGMHTVVKDPDPRLGLSVSDYVYSVEMACPYDLEADSANECDFDLIGIVTQNSPTVVTMALLGEVEYCNENPSDWKSELATMAATNKDIYTRDTNVEPQLLWRACTVTANGESYDHQSGPSSWIYVHDDPNAPVHPWPFNNVRSGHSTDDSSATGYFETKIVVGSTDYSSTYTNKGIWAYVEHVIADAQSEEGITLAQPEVAHLIHGDSDLDGRSGLRGVAQDLGSDLSIVKDPEITHAHLTAAHELGHNLNAGHCDAARVSGDLYTLMVSFSSSAQSACDYDPEPDDRDDSISSTSASKMNTYAQNNF